MQQLRIVGIGGSTRPDSSSEVALRIALAACAAAGTETTLLSAASLALPFYDPVQAKQSTAADGYLQRTVVHTLVRASRSAEPVG